MSALCPSPLVPLGGSAPTCAQVSYIPQTPALFNRSILDNVRYGNEGSVSEAQAIAFMAHHGVLSEFANLEEGVHMRAGLCVPD